MKKYVKIFLSLVVALMMIGMVAISNATTITEAEIEEFVNAHSSVDPENMTTEDIVGLYEDLTEKYTNEELADAVEQYSMELQGSGVDADLIKTVAAVLRTTDEKALREILANADIDEIIAELENTSRSSGNVLPGKAIIFLLQVLLANKIVKLTIIACVIIAIYMIIVRWVIYKKAGKHGWAAIIPIYRDIVWLKIAGISPWVLLLVLLPVIGWFILAIIFLVSKFTLPQEFGRSAGWGLGIWILPIIFEAVVAFSNGFQYQRNK